MAFESVRALLLILTAEVAVASFHHSFLEVSALPTTLLVVAILMGFHAMMPLLQEVSDFVL